MKQIYFHLAFPVHDLKKAKQFYVKGLGCKLGRESKHSLILDLQGHQLVAQLTKESLKPQRGIYPRHFGLIFEDKKEWDRLLKKAKKNKLRLYQEAKVRFLKTRLEHSTFFLEDPSYNLLEFKTYKFKSAIFGEKRNSQIGDYS